MVTFPRNIPPKQKTLGPLLLTPQWRLDRFGLSALGRGERVHVPITWKHIPVLIVRSTVWPMPKKY